MKQEELFEEKRETISQYVNVQALAFVDEFDVPLKRLTALIWDCLNYQKDYVKDPNITVKDKKKSFDLEKDIALYKLANQGLYQEHLYRDFLDYWTSFDPEKNMQRWRIEREKKREAVIKRRMKDGMDYNSAKKGIVLGNWFDLASRLRTFYKKRKAYYDSPCVGMEGTSARIIEDETTKRAFLNKVGTDLKSNFSDVNEYKQFLLDWYSETLKAFFEHLVIQKVEFPRLYEDTRNHYVNWLKKSPLFYIQQMKPTITIKAVDTFSGRE